MVEEKEVEKVKEESNVPVEKEAVIGKEVELKKEPEGKIMIDLTGEGFKNQDNKFDRPLIKEDSYNATIQDIVFKGVQKWNSAPGVLENKFIFNYLIEQPVGEPLIIPSFINPSITKSNNSKYSNSKLFEIISVAGLLDEVGKLADELSVPSNLVKWVSQVFIGRDCRVSIENNKAGTCSVIRKVLSFEPQEAK
ncbi:MAG TPA: hypothetical protein VMW25_02035 [Clostridia bacterium]|nr:hypothetical protein [Clostridia bacterium]